MNTELRAFHNDKEIKAKYINRMKVHIKLDELVQGVGFEKNGETKGCFIGCTFDEYNSSRFPIELGIPEWLGKLAEAIFEGLPEKDSVTFATKFYPAIPLGANLEPIRFKFALFLLKENVKRQKEHLKKVKALKISDDLKKQIVDSIEKYFKAAKLCLELLREAK